MENCEKFPIFRENRLITITTRHRASASMYSLTFCVRVMSPERYNWNSSVQAAAVMLRTPPVDGQSPASQPRLLTIYGAQFSERPRHPPVTDQQRAHTPPSVRIMSSYHGMDTSLYLGFALYCHSNATRAPIANPPNSAQLGGNHYHSPSYIQVLA